MLKKHKRTLSRMGLAIGAVFLATCGTTAQPAANSRQRDLVLEGGTLIDGTGRSPIPDAVIVVEGSRIKAVGRRGQVPIPANANIINLEGRTILPGLIDSHVHTKEWQLPMFLHYGVTTVADLDNDTAWIIAQRDGVKSGKIKGPRMFVSGTFVWGPLKPEVQGVFNTPPVKTVEETRAYVRSLIAAGVDIIKTDYGLTDDQLRVVIEEANRAGLPAMGHTQNILRAAKLGFKHEEHMDTMARSIIDPDEKIRPTQYPDGRAPDPSRVVAEAKVDPKQFPPLIATMVRDGVYVNPTLVAGWFTSTPHGLETATIGAQLAKDPELAFVPAESKVAWSRPVKRLGEGYANVAEFLKEYSAAGGKVIVGTDSGGSGVIAGLSVHEEMQMLTDVGIPPMKVIQGATLWNAEVIKKDKDLGSVEPGKIADFTVIEGNPLADIRTTRNVRMVIKDGQIIDTKYDPKWFNPIPEPYQEYPPPEITNFSPRMAHQDGRAVTLQIQGTKFTPNAIVRFNDADLPTHFVSNTQLTATLDARLLRTDPGSYPIYVVFPGRHGTVSEPAYFLVNFKQ